MRPGKPTTRSLLSISVLLLIVAAAYGPLIHHEFLNYDDPLYVSENGRVRGGLSLDGVRWAFITYYSANWHPLTWLSHMLDVELFGLNPGPHHLTSLLLHLANTLLLFIVLRRYTPDFWMSFFVAALFALHPLHVESVAWISERKDVLSTFFWLLTLAAYERYVRRPSGLRYLPLFALLALGLMAKPMLVTLPLVLLFLDYWPLGRFPRGALSSGSRRGATSAFLLWEKVPLLALSLLSSLITYKAQSLAQAVWPVEEYSFGRRLSNALVSYAAYLGKTIWPRGLAVFYPLPADGWPLWKVTTASFLLGSLTLWAVSRAGKNPYLIVGWLWYVVALVPVIGLVQVGDQAMADRYTYVPLIGLFIAIVWGAANLAAGWELRRAAAATSAIILVSLAALTWAQVGHWKNDFSLNSHAIEAVPGNWRAHNNLGAALFNKGNVREAIDQFNESLRIHPRYANARLNLANLLVRQGYLDQAAKQLQESLKANPSHLETYVRLGNILARQGRYREAEATLGRALEINPRFAGAHDNLGAVLYREGRFEEALGSFSRAADLDPDLASARLNMGLTLEKMGRHDEAIRSFREVLRMDPGHAVARSSLEQALRRRGGP